MNQIKLQINCETDTQMLAADIAMAAGNGMLIKLNGDLGAGKSSFARAFIRHYLDAPDMEIPSPTYLISIEHQNPSGVKATHLDLYRISGSDELEELGLEDALTHSVVLIEWPQNAADALPEPTLEITIEITGEFTRQINIQFGNKADLIKRSISIGSFLRQNWSKNISRTPFPADASSRNYEKVETDSEMRILMDAPKTPDGPPVQNGLPYSQIAHLAEEVRPFVAIANTLNDHGFCAPQIYARDYDDGLILLEHLGNGKIVDEINQPIAERYIDSGELLANMHAIDWPQQLTMDDGEIYQIPNYDTGAMHIEVQLLAEWYLRDFDGKFSADDIAEFNAIWKDYCAAAQDFRKSIVLRDYHSPNIIWREHHDLNQRIGLIDFQDALIGPAAYDVASLAQDARVVVPDELESQIIDRYLKSITAVDANFDAQKFEFEYALMGALRASKVLGFCVRVDLRDGKPQYRKLIPSVRHTLKKNLQHPALAEYKNWCERVIGL